jgi:thiosulfate/3-mercaptopyruvate sulfurtransferase
VSESRLYRTRHRESITGEVHLLISAQDLAAKLGAPDWVIVDCRFSLMKPDAGWQSYLEGHLPGAHYANLDRDLAAPRAPCTGRHPLPEPRTLRAAFSRWGVRPATHVIAYDDAGGAIAARLWWLLRWMGHRQAGLLDGGFNAWRAAGLPLATAATPAAAGEFHGEPGHMPTVDVAGIEANLRTARLTVLDARAPGRFQGREEPIDPVAGHVPGAVNAPFQDNLTSDGRFRPAEELRARFVRLAAERTPDEIVSMCGSGVTACHTLFALDVAGLHGARLYNGSWSEWITVPKRPIASGPSADSGSQESS